MLQLLLMHQPPYWKNIIDRVTAARKKKYPNQKLKWAEKNIINNSRKLWDSVVLLQFSNYLYILCHYGTVKNKVFV